jgi:outer membrane murein-binding lipoprotein Lpp
MPVTEGDFNDLKTRVARLERASLNNTETITWLASTLGGMKAVQDNHTERLDRIEADVSELKADVSELKADVRGLKADVAGLRKDMPGIVAEAMREVMRKP